MRKGKIGDVNIDLISLEEIVDIVLAELEVRKRPIQIIGVNSETIAKTDDHPRLLDAINSADIVNIDNTFVYLSLLLKGYKPKKRVPCPDLMDRLLEEADEKSLSVYVLGAEQHVVENAVNNIKIKHPGIDFKGFHHGFFEDEQKMMEEVASTQPDFLFIALPSPQKEVIGSRYKHLFNHTVIFGIGGAIDVWGQKVKRAPKFLRKLGLEGVLRVMQSPKNYGGRVLKYYPRFTKMVFRKNKN